MAGNMGDVYVAIAGGTFNGEDWRNRFWYVLEADESEDSVAGVLTAALDDDCYSDLSILMSQFWEIDFIEAYKWRDAASDYDYLGLAYGGSDILTNAMPSSIALSYRSPKGTPGQRYGHKRFAGLPEAMVNGNAVSSEAVFDNVGTFLGNYIATSNTRLIPCIVRSSTIPGVSLGVNPTVTRYVLGNWTYFLGTQASRKPGYGS